MKLIILKYAYNIYCYKRKTFVGLEKTNTSDYVEKGERLHQYEKFV